MIAYAPQACVREQLRPPRQHSPHAPGAVLDHHQLWPAYAVALVITTRDDETCGAVLPKDVARHLGMRPTTAEGHLRLLVKAGFARRDDDGGWVPIWGDAPEHEPARRVPPRRWTSRHQSDDMFVVILTTWRCLVRPAYDLTDPYEVARWIEDHGEGEARHARFRPPGSERIWAGYLASLAQFVPQPGRAEQLTADEALAALTLTRAVRAWAADLEPDLIEAARTAGVTWEALAPHLGVADRRAAQRRYARLTTPNAPDWASGDDFTAVADLLAAHGYARQPDTGDGVVRWNSTRTDLPKVRVWIGPYHSHQGFSESMIQINDSHDSGGQGKDALIGELSSKTSHQLLAECLTSREEEGFYDADFYDDIDV